MLQLTDFFERIESIKQKVAQAKQSGEKIIVVFGWTRSGKSTTINALMGSKLRSNEKNELVVEPGNPVYAEIGHGDHSHTLNPELVHHKESSFSIFDTAGLMDERAEGHETESATAACSLPILLQDSAVHAVLLVVSKNFLDPEGKYSFSELFKSLGHYINFEHELVRRKTFIAMTKTVELGTVKEIEDVISTVPNNLQGPLQKIINDTYNKAENQIRDKLKIRKNTLKLKDLIDERPSFGNVFMFHGIKNETDGFWKKLTACSLVHSKFEPQVDTIDTLQLPTEAAYVRYKNQLYYVNRFELSVTEIEVSPNVLKELDAKLSFHLLTDDNALRSLQDNELELIAQLTNHVHLKEVMHPLRDNALLQSPPVVLESKFSQLRVRIEAIAIDKQVSEVNPLRAFKQALVDMVQAYHLLHNRAIHLPNLDILRANALQKALLEVFAFYAQHEVKSYPDCLKSLLTCLSELPDLLTANFKQTESVDSFLKTSIAHLTQLLNMTLPHNPLSKKDQITFMSQAMSRLNFVTEPHAREYQQILDNMNKGTDYLYWQQLMNSCIQLAKEKDSFQYDASRNESFAAVLNHLIRFDESYVDDALIAIMANTLLAISKAYKKALPDSLPMTKFPLANNLPMMHQVLQSMIEFEENQNKVDPDPHGYFFQQTKENLLRFKAEIDALQENPTELLQKLLTDYYQCAKDIDKSQSSYISAYEQNQAQGVDLLAGPTPYIDSFSGKNITASLAVAGGGTLDAFAAGKIDKHLLAAEALKLSSFSLDSPSITDGVTKFTLDSKEFAALLNTRVTDDKILLAGSLSGWHLFDNKNAQWERNTAINFFDTKVYNARVYKTYEHFQAKIALHKTWNNKHVAQDGNTPHAPGNLVVNFGAYTAERQDPYWVKAYNNTDGYSTYTSGPNPEYQNQTQKLEAKIRQAMRDYIDIQLSRVEGKSLSWTSEGQSITLSTLDSEIQLLDQGVITKAQKAINDWFITHRTNLANNFSQHKAHPGLPDSAQKELDKRKTLLINLDIQRALILLFAKLIGKNPLTSCFEILIGSETIKASVAKLPDLTIRHPAPGLQKTLEPQQAITGSYITKLDHNSSTMSLHPKNLLIRLENRLTLHSAWRELRIALPVPNQCMPSKAVSPLTFLRSIPEQASQLEIRCHDLTSATNQACLVLVIKNRSRFLQQVTLHRVNMKHIANILQVSESLEALYFSENPLEAEAFTDIQKFIVRNSSLRCLDISANPSEKPIILTEKAAISLLAALYLNRHLEVLSMQHIVFENPLIGEAIKHIMLHKSRINALPCDTEEAYFEALDEALDGFLKKHAHPISDLDASNLVFRGEAKEAKPLRAIIASIRAEKPATAPTTKPTVADLPNSPKKPTQSAKSSSQSFFPRPIPRFFVDFRKTEQNGWNCFDVAVGLTRNELVRYALDHRNDEAFRALLAPEIRHAAAISVSIMNDPSHSRAKADEKAGLPKSMCNSKLQDLVNNYEQLGEEQAFFDYSSALTTYCQYINTYYNKGGWVAFQADNSGSMVEIAARKLEATIIIHQPVAQRHGEWREIYRTTNASSSTREIHIQLVNNSHFTALRPNPNYKQEGSSTNSYTN